MMRLSISFTGGGLIGFFFFFPCLLFSGYEIPGGKPRPNFVSISKVVSVEKFRIRIETEYASFLAHISLQHRPKAQRDNSQGINSIPEAKSYS